MRSKTLIGRIQNATTTCGNVSSLIISGLVHGYFYKLSFSSIIFFSLNCIHTSTVLKNLHPQENTSAVKSHVGQSEDCKNVYNRKSCSFANTRVRVDRALNLLKQPNIVSSSPPFTIFVAVWHFNCFPQTLKLNVKYVSATQQYIWIFN